MSTSGPTAAQLTSAQNQSAVQPVEVVADRTQYTDTYQVPGGGYETKVSVTPINYALSAQSWAPINDTLTTDAATGFAAENTANSYKAEFPTSLASPVRVGTSAAWVTSSLVGAGGTLKESGDTATYTNALPGVTVTYAAEADQVKESLILASAAAPSAFVYHLAVSPGASLTQDGNNVDLVDGGATVATIPASTVADGSGAIGAVTSTLATDPNGGWDFTVTVSAAWLADASRVFPVTVDPSLYLGYSNFCEIDSYTPTTSNCTSGTGELSVGTVSHSSTLYKQRDLVQFTLGSNIPYDALVTNAQMVVNATSDSESILAQPVYSTWNSNATWNDAESGTSWETPSGSATTGGSIVAGYTASGYTASFDAYAQFNWNVTGAVQDWITSHSYPGSAGVTNNGFLLKSTDESDNGNVAIASPTLSIFWQYRMGDQAGLSYDKTAIDDQASLGVAATNGNGRLTTNDLNIPGVGNNLSVSHTYNSWAAGDGSGWSFSVGEDTKALLYQDHSVVLYDGTGNAQVFTEQPTAVPQPCVVNGTSYTTDLLAPLDTNDCAHGTNEFTPTGHIFLVDNNTQTSYTFGGTANASNSDPTNDAEYAYYLTAITDRNGNSITFSYNSSNQLTSMTDTEGRTFTVTPDTANGEPATIAGPTGATGANYRTWTYAWSTSNPAQLDHYIDPAGKYTRYYYDSNGNLDEVLAPGTAAGTTETDLDIGTLGETRGVTLDDSSCPSGACTTTYDTARVPQPTTSNPACTSYAGSGETISQPTTMVGCATVTDPRGKVTSYGYSVLDTVVKTVDANHHVSLNTYTTDHNQPMTGTDALGNTGSNTYDATSQNLATSTAPATGSGQTAALSVQAFNTSPTAVNGGAYLPSSASDPSKDCAYYAYDGNGNRTEVLTGLTATGTSPTLSCNGTSPPATSALTTYAYQGDGTTSCGGQPGQLCFETSPNNQGPPQISTAYSYTNGELTTVTPPSPMGATTYTYDANGRVLTVTDGAGRTTAYTYDADNRVLTTNSNASDDPTCANHATCIVYTYDANGNRTSMLDNTGTTTWSYNQRNAMTAEYLPGAASRTCGESPTGPDNITQVTDTGIHYGYDADGNLTGYCDAGGTVSYAYDAVNNLTGVADPGGNCTPGSIVQPCTQYGYNNANQKTSITYPTAMGASETLTPDGAGHVKQFTVTEAGNTVIARTYSYADPVTATIDRDRLNSVDDTVAHVTTAYSYTHTPYLQCANETNDPGHTTPGLTLLTYVYDGDGNMTSTTSGRSSCTATSGGTTSNYSYNNADQSTTGSAAFDGAGNQTETQSGTNLTYNPLTQTTAIGSSDPLTYTGGGQGGLNGDSSTSLQSSSILGVTAVTASGSTVYFTRDPNGNLVTMRVGAANYSYVLDSAKTVIALLAASGTSPAATYTYDPYGKQLTTLMGVGATNPFQYNSGYQTASGDIHFGARYYDPNIGRWTQLDPSGQNVGYAFASDNPVNQSDPSGKFQIYLSSDASNNLAYGLTIGGIASTIVAIIGVETPGVTEIGGLLAAALGGEAATIYNQLAQGSCVEIQVNTFEGVPYGTGLEFYSPCGSTREHGSL